MQLFKFSDEEWDPVRPAWCLFVGMVDARKALVASIGLRYQGVMLLSRQRIIPGGKNPCCGKYVATLRRMLVQWNANRWRDRNEHGAAESREYYFKLV